MNWKLHSRETQQRVLTHTLPLLRHRLQAEAGNIGNSPPGGRVPSYRAVRVSVAGAPVLDGFPDEWNGQGAQPHPSMRLDGEPDQARFTLLPANMKTSYFLCRSERRRSPIPPLAQEGNDGRFRCLRQSLIAFAGRALAFKPQALVA